MPSPVFLSRPRSGMNVWAVVRGAQLTFVGTYRALQNPALLDAKFYKAALYTAAICLLLHGLVLIPIYIFRIFLTIGTWIFVGSQRRSSIFDLLVFIENAILDLPGLMIILIRLLAPELLDEIFMSSLHAIDAQNKAKHPGLQKLYYPQLSSDWKASDLTVSAPSFNLKKRLRMAHVSKYAYRHARRVLLSLAVYVASSLPLLGRYVMPAMTFSNIYQIAGLYPALALGASTLITSRQLNAALLTSFFGARACSRQLLQPYFARLPKTTFTNQERKQWYARREGILLGFGLAFFWLLRVPYFGAFAYGFAQASAAYLITKITDPPPSQHSELHNWVTTQL
ncbi:hypothetical protein CANCADRAFT_44518 [Tortispora caseinolytica NRRL Y-17796]|uniref:Transmembrane protein UsgS n=1 Tax=Tortispora caseinolytica NRRL Y-17796 TaxID=767744 RepID=A0A1E4TGT6_9ASCO|nr:hypothetical protein CANCADRAFT_44518 [Tortispora caseinolytica NRRL Y-17796]